MSDWRDLRRVELNRYQGLGWPIFPLRATTKWPATEHGFKDASSDPVDWRWWFADSNDGIGLPTGLVSGIAVVDIDPRNGGEQSLARLEAEHGPLPESAVSLTGGGGRHFLFRIDAALRCCKMADGVDLKADGGYIVAPPSIHPSGALYRWQPGRAPDALPLAPLPPWCRRKSPRPAAQSEVAHKAVANPETAKERFFVAHVGRARDDLLLTTEGNRNNALNKAAFAVGQIATLASSRNLDWALSCLRAAAAAIGLDRDEIEPTLQSGFQAGLQNPRKIEFTQREKHPHG
jgi:hypothetical protein